MPSDKAIKAAQREAISRNLSPAWQEPNDLYHVLSAASAIDGDFNDGVEAAAKEIEACPDITDETATMLIAEILKLKR